MGERMKYASGQTVRIVAIRGPEAQPPYPSLIGRVVQLTEVRDWQPPACYPYSAEIDGKTRHFREDELHGND